MKNVISREVKIQVAAEFIKNEGIKNKEVAEKYGISDRSAGRFKKDFYEEAVELLKQQSEAKEATKKDTKRGFQGRNGRMNVLREAFAKFGLEGDRKELMEKVNAFCEERGIDAMTKVQFNYFLYVFKKKQSQ